MTERYEPKDSDVLLVVDLQNDFCTGGALGVRDGETVVPLANKLAAVFPHVVLTQDWHPRDHFSFASAYAGKLPFEVIEASYGPQVLWPDHCVQGTSGAAFHADLDPARAELIIRKGFRRHIDSYSAFYENDRQTPTGLAGYLRERGLRHVFICGLATDFCVAYSAEDARREGFEVTVVADACRAIDLAGSLGRAMETMKAAGVVVSESAHFLGPIGAVT
jgi:nicotinamidase/pyrazinamidase